VSYGYNLKVEVFFFLLKAHQICADGFMPPPKTGTLWHNQGYFLLPFYPNCLLFLKDWFDL